MGVARGYYGAAYPAGECVGVLCPVGCTARRVSRGEKGGLYRKWMGFSGKTPLETSDFIFVNQIFLSQGFYFFLIVLLKKFGL